MFSIVDIFYIVFSQLAIGGFVLLLFIPRGLVGANFYRLMGGIYLVVSGLARCANLSLLQQPVTFSNFFGIGHRLPNHLLKIESVFVLIFFILILIYTLSWWFKSPRLTQLLFFTGILCGGIWLFLSAARYLEIIQIPGERVLLPIQFLTSAVLLGAVHTGMWFGHWYLVTPDLPVAYLKRFNSLFLYSLLCIAWLFGVNVFFHWQTAGSVPFNFYYRLIFGMRVIIGLCGTLFLYFITWYCLRDKSVAADTVGATRAATGFLFIAIITVFIGEFCSRLLLLEMRYIF